MSFKNENAIKRVTEMEGYFDLLQEILNHSPKRIADEPQINEIYQKLVRYYESKDWIDDFEADERGEFPDSLKRGILSEDGIYNLIFEINEFMDLKDWKQH